jgi:hypothetical protein
MAARSTAEIYVADLAIEVAALQPGVRAKRKSSVRNKNGFRHWRRRQRYRTTAIEKQLSYLDVGSHMRQACHLVPTNG